jgi:hypothetical protein
MSASVPHRLVEAVARRPLIEVAPRRALVRFPGVGRILVTDEGVVSRRADPGRTVEELAFLDDVVHALAGLLVGQFSLRASVVEIDGSGVALCGAGPIGKSTVAAALWMRGHRFVADAVARVTMCAGAPVILGPPRGPALWPDAVERLGLDSADGAVVRTALPVRRFAVDAGPGSTRLASLVLLRRRDEAEGAPANVTGFDAVTAFVRGCWHRFAIAPLGLSPTQFEWATKLARRVRVVTLDVPRHEADPRVLADAVLGHLALTGSQQ